MNKVYSKTLFVLTLMTGAFVYSTSSLAGVSEDTLKSINDFWLQMYPGPNAGQRPVPGLSDMTIVRKRLSKARPDECFYGVGNPNNFSDVDDDFASNPVCPTVNLVDGVPKVNGGYVWGMGKWGRFLWWGTIANSVCTIPGTLGLGQIMSQNSAYVCEGAASAGGAADSGDWRLPKIIRYDWTRDDQVEYTLSGEHLARLNRTTGLRAVGAQHNVVILAGPSVVAAEPAVYMFAFNASTGDFLGSAEYREYNNIRDIRPIRDQLYFALGNTSGGGTILRWTGDRENPFSFQSAGTLPGPASFIAEHEGRLFVSSWPDLAAGGEFSVPGLFMSPGPLSSNGALAISTGQFTEVFNFLEYEPDFVTALAYAGGALSSFGGYLYFGTMHFPGAGALAAVQAHNFCQANTPACVSALGFNYNIDADNSGSLEGIELLGAFLGTYRATTLFRGQNFSGGAPDVEIVYGNPILPTFDPATRVYSNLTANNMLDPEPQLGLSGFNDFFNLYSWSMAVYDDKLFVGTFDWTFLLGADFFTSSFFAQLLSEILDSGILETIDPEDLAAIRFPLFFPGGDIYRFDDTDNFARAETISGLGNISNYGFRTMIADENIWLGTANPMNLLVGTRTIDGFSLDGGWEVYQLGQYNFAVMVPALSVTGLVLLSMLLMLVGIRRRRKSFDA